MSRREIIIKDTHRGLWYEDGVLVKVLEAGRYVLPRRWFNVGPLRRPRVEVAWVDVRERDLTIKGQEILTSDKVALRVSIIVQFRVTDPRAALHEVESYEDRIYTDVQLAARRALASMPLEEILTNRNRLSEEILNDVKEAAASYGISILRADVKDLIFPGNLQEIMNRVLTAERLAQAQLVEARTQAETQRLDAETRAEVQHIEEKANVEEERRRAEHEAEMSRVKTASQLEALRDLEPAGKLYHQYPELLRLRELETLRELAHNGNARLYIHFDRNVEDDED